VDDEMATVDILAQVSRLQVASRMLDDSHTYDETKILLGGDYMPQPKVIGTATVLGYIRDDGAGRSVVRVPRSTPLPGARVYEAGDDLLRRFFTANIKSGIEAGTLINRPDVPVKLDPNGLRRHLAIIAQTGAGKSYLSGLVLENLLQLGGTIVVFDPNSDYVRLRYDNQRNKTPFAGRVNVYRVPGVEGRRYSDDEIGGADEYTIWFSKLEPDEICDLAGVASTSLNIRTAVRRACTALQKEGRDYRPEDLMRRLYKMAGVEPPDEEPTIRPIGPVTVGGEMLDPDEDVFDFHDALEERASVPLKRGRGKAEEGAAATTEDVRGGAEKAIKYIEALTAYKIWGFKDMERQMDRLLEPKSLSVVDLAGMEQSIAQYAVQKTLREVWRRATTGKLDYPVFLVLEEAHNFVPGKDKGGVTECARWINRIASEGRKFKVFLVVITQRPGKIDPDTLSQCGSQMIMKLTNPTDQDAVRKASESLSESLFTDLPGLNTGEAIVLGPLTRVPCLIQVGRRLSAEGGSDIDVTAELEKARNTMTNRRIESQSVFATPVPIDRVEEI
jgi:DNA helicase HerA-like ATPase